MQLEGIKVLGESLALVFSGLLRLQLSPRPDGVMRLSANLPRREGDAHVLQVAAGVVHRADHRYWRVGLVPT